MGWKSVAWASCLLPVLAGCGTVRTWTTGTRLAPATSAYEYDQRSDANAAWAAVQAKHSQRAFSDEFRDGFLAGYTDFRDRGADVRPPAVPPADYAHYKKYATPDGEGLVRDYYLGFQYGIDVAASGGRWAGSAAPPAPPVKPAPAKPTTDTLPPPRPVPGKPADPKKKGSDDPPPLDPPPLKPERPKPELPVIEPFNPDRAEGGKFAPLPVPPNPDLLPVPNPPIPIPDPLPVLPAFKLTAPAAADAPMPVYIPPPPFMERLPVIPFRYTPPAK